MATTAREFTQTGDSMAPTIVHGDKIEAEIISSFFYEPKRWDIILFMNPDGKSNNLLISRIIGMPHEEIYINDKGLHINGKLIALPKKMHESNISYLPINKTVVGKYYKNRRYVTKENEYFVLGDNSYASKDSRFYGPVHRDYIANKIEKK